MSLEELKLFLRIDDDDEDELIKALQLSSEGYLTNAGINKDYSNELYKLAIKLLVSHWYENRSPDNAGKSMSKIIYGLDMLIIQLKYTQEDVNI